MADLTGSDRRTLEKLFGMGSGFVLNFSDRTFGDFFDEYRVECSSSKANRMRTLALMVCGRVEAASSFATGIKLQISEAAEAP